VILASVPIDQERVAADVVPLSMATGMISKLERQSAAALETPSANWRSLSTTPS
jgi:hypothetical protein